MEYEKIKQLMDDMGNSKLTSIEIDFPDGMKISMKKEEKQIIKVSSIEDTTEINKDIIDTDLKNCNSEFNSVSKNKIDNNSNEEEKYNIVKSPIVGTFYLKPSPDSEAYVQVGKKVKKGDILCIIEAMKLMNEIESEFDGEIIEILVKDSEPVEYGKSLFKIK